MQLKIVFVLFKNAKRKTEQLLLTHSELIANIKLLSIKNSFYKIEYESFLSKKLTDFWGTKICERNMSRFLATINDYGNETCIIISCVVTSKPI